ncbi:Dihydropteroate synthase-like protein [Lentinula boryana]|uniref:Dihydropteroate synthase-like protein n=1 Tax=Lentinula boryana TaxID=40481 RepID=A0ABQ8PX35_9AGAR|nr:Dihydropteroate synthase-like protein [Lentinula boryana]
MVRVIKFPRYPLPVNVTLIFPEVDPVPSMLIHWKYTISRAHTILSPKSRDRTHLMAMLNATPDSFSNGSTHNTIPTALEYVRESAQAAVDIIDIGGYFTRPGATFVSAQEEIDRVVPIIQTVREMPISVDTFRWEYAVPVILMHSRGDAGQNKSYSEYEYVQDQSVIEGVWVKLGMKVDEIVKGKGGIMIRRCNVIVDPGIGFSKTVEGTLELLRQGAAVTADVTVGQGLGIKRNPLVGFPQLVGVSRKS